MFLSPVPKETAAWEERNMPTPARGCEKDHKCGAACHDGAPGPERYRRPVHHEESEDHEEESGGDQGHNAIKKFLDT
jgi:hypothetical protein